MRIRIAHLHGQRLPERRDLATLGHVLNRQRVSVGHDDRLFIAAEVTVVLRDTRRKKRDVMGDATVYILSS